MECVILTLKKVKNVKYYFKLLVLIKLKVMNNILYYSYLKRAYKTLMKFIYTIPIQRNLQNTLTKIH